MAYTRHGHHIPGSVDDGVARMKARCGGVRLCSLCKQDAGNWHAHPSNQAKSEDRNVFEHSDMIEETAAYSEQTLNKAALAICQGTHLTRQQANDVIVALLNNGLLIRERL